MGSAAEIGDQGRGRPDGRTGPGPGCDWRRARASFLDLHAVGHGVFLDSAVVGSMVLVAPSARRPDRTWLNKSRPPAFWMTGWFNPTGFLTAMKQEVTRKHKADKWALDEVDYRTEVTTMERVDQCRAAPPEGVYVHGLFLDGAALDNKQGLLVESVPKTLIVPLPVLFVSGLVRDEAVKRRIELFGKHGPY